MEALFNQPLRRKEKVEKFPLSAVSDAKQSLSLYVSDVTSLISFILSASPHASCLKYSGGSGEMSSEVPTDSERLRA
jgi:hypothetical protein